MAKRLKLRKRIVHWTKYFNRATSEYEEKTLEEPHHSEHCDNVSSQTDNVMPDSQREAYVQRVK